MDAHDWDARYADSELLWSEDPNRFVEQTAAALVPGRALDLACGEGRNAIWLARLGWQVTGVDFSAVAIDRARHLADAADVEVDWRCEDADTFDAEPCAFDFVLLSYLHLPPGQMAAVLSNAPHALAAGGILCVVGHARANLTDGIGGPQDPDVLYEPEDVIAWLGALEPMRAEHVTRTVATDSGPRDAIDTLVVATRGSI